MKVISIGTDRNLFMPESAVRERIKEYGALFDELHIVVFSKRSLSHVPEQISPTVWIYPTSSLVRWMYIRDAVSLCLRIISKKGLEQKETVITCQDPFETGLAGLRLKRKTRFPLHIQVHTDLLSPFFVQSSALNRLRVLIAKRVLKSSDAVRVVSVRIKKSLVQKGWVPSVLTVLPIFIDQQKILDTPVTINLREKYPQFNFIILIAARFTKEKNISLALEVLSKLVVQYPRVGLVIVGTGPQAQVLKSEAARLKLVRNVVFEPWQQNLASYYKTAHVFLVTSDYEGYGMTIVEALTAQCPVISTDVGIAPDVLVDGDSFVCPPCDCDCLVKKLKIYIENNPIRETFTQEAITRLPRVTHTSKQVYLNDYKASIESARRV